MKKAVKQGVTRFAFSDVRKKCATDKANKESLQSVSQVLAHSSTRVTKKHYITDALKATPLKQLILEGKRPSSSRLAA